jgi:hypothetical protein
VVGGTGTQQGGNFVGLGEARLGAVVEELDLNVEVSQMLIHGLLQLLGQENFVLGKLVGTIIVVKDLGSELILFGVGLMAAVGLDPFLDLAISILYEADAIVVLSVFVGNLLVDEANLLREVLDAIDPVIEDQAGVEGLSLRHPLDEIYGQIVSRHY